MGNKTKPTARRCDATIAICTYNRIHTLPRTLDSLAMLRGPYTFEVIVVNGPSDDGTDEYLETRDDIRVFDNDQANLSISRNIAIANAAGEFVAFIDDDAIPEPDWLDNVVSHLKAKPDLAAVGGFIRDANGISFQAKYTYCDVFGNSYPCDNPDYAVFAGKEKRLFPSLTGTNVTFRKSALEEVAGFDEVFAYYLDETDVNKRMDDAGMKVEVLPHAEIHHKYAPSHLRTDTNVPKDMMPIARSVGYFALRHGAADEGWEAVGKRLKQFYRDEFSWKSQMLASGGIQRDQMVRLMHQVRRGLLDGIDAYFDNETKDPAPDQRILRHTDTQSPPVIRNMEQGDGLRLCMFARDHTHREQGGIGRWTNLVAKGLAERGNEVTLIGEMHEDDAHQYCDFTKDGYWAHSIGFHGQEAGREVDCLGLPDELANVAKRKRTELLRVMPRRDFQVLSSPIWDVEGAAVIGQGDLPNVLSLHTSAGLMLASKPEWKEDRHFYENHVLRVINAEVQAIRRADMILANSRAVMQDLTEVYGVDLFEQPHCIVPHGIEDIVSPEGLLKTRQQDADAPLRILFLGRLETRKGIAHLVPVLRQLLQTRQNVVVDLVGSKVDDVNMAMVQGLLDEFPDRVTWHGFISDADLDGLMRRSDVFFAPSLYESFGLIFAEAMRYSIPSVGYAVGGVTEVVDSGTDGILAPLEDQKALYQALENLVTDKRLRNKMSKAARISFETKFHYAQMAERLEEMYRGVALPR